MPLTRQLSQRTTRQLEAALEAADLGVWEWDVTRDRITWTPTLERIYGLREGTFDGRFESYLGFIHEDDRDSHLEVVQQAAAALSGFAYRYRIVRSDGSIRWLRGSGHALVDDDGTLIGMTGVCSDITVQVERDRIADALSRSLLPPSLPVIPGVALAALYEPSTADVSGDFFDVFPLGSEWGVVIGDVCGKGAEAASLTSLTRYTVRGAAITAPSVPAVLEVLNQALVTERTNRFCTAIYLRLRRTAVGLGVALTAGGHPPALVRRASGVVEEVAAGGRIIGVFDEMGAQEVAVGLAPGDLLVLYTDGVTEARCGGEMFGEERLREVLGGTAAGSAEGAAVAIGAGVRAFTSGPQTDDLAVLVIEATAPEPTGPDPSGGG
ncbi:MAG: PP2C family protein-serine/threonine phosphatase [Acidimicrobiales bacterium]